MTVHDTPIRRTTRLAAGILAAGLLVPLGHADDGFERLFDGKTLAGWKQLPGGTWEVRDGVIVGSQENTESRHGILLSEKQYANFILRARFRSIDGNSGLYFRAQPVDHVVAVKGFQAEIDSEGKDIGGVYETLGRAWVARPDAADVTACYHAKDWNHMTVTAFGGNVVVSVNGVQTAALREDPGERRGHIGLQLHGGQKMHVEFKDIEIRALPDDTPPVIADAIHDTARPIPRFVEPKSLDALAKSRTAPAGAVVLFDGGNLDAWSGGPWKIQDGVLETVSGNLTSKDPFGDCGLHIEWRVPDKDGHGNSGIYMMGLYEVQIFNSHHNHSPIYADGQAAAIYGQYPALVNACRPAGEWEVFDIAFRGPRFDPSGRVKEPAVISVVHNGVLVQDRVPLTGPTDHKNRPPYAQHADRLPFYIQFHGDRLQFRNIWIVNE
ncbi:MAG: DUF1080 domain-containing protein [Planctomycetes bacterium]|nr:DUF1080 domain-containing protein [Planctomycetota bacterium]